MAGFTPAPEPGVESGTIAIWHGTLANIPSGWVLCDGTNSTPDLRDKFVRGAAAGADPGATGGTTEHYHAYGSEGGGAFGQDTLGPYTDTVSHLPPYYAVAYIMKT